MESDPCVQVAVLWEKEDQGKAKCHLCAHECLIAPGFRGICGVRENQDGTLKTLVYGRLVAERPDPIEKKPLFHFLPGTLTHSIATAGCNMRCKHCQNYAISQVERGGAPIQGAWSDPADVVERAIKAGASSLSYTYNEPTVFMEYALETMRLAHERGLLNVFVTNGFMTGAALEKMDGLLDAANVDLKAMTDTFYREVCGARLDPVLHSITQLKEMGVWLEVTTLVIPGLNDSEEELRNAARFIVSTDESIPWHLSGFYPTYKLTDRGPTSESLLAKARDFGLSEGLKFVYEGNRPGSHGENTYCPGCGKKVISRQGFMLNGYRLDEQGRCATCGESVPGRFGGSDEL